MAKQTEFLGYDIEPVSDFGKVNAHEVAYVLTGKRGAQYALVRTGKVLQAVALSTGNFTGLKGNYTFSDARGQLECVGYCTAR